MDKIKFSHDEESPLEIVRLVVLEMLRAGDWDQFPVSTERFNNKIEFVGNVSLARTNFLVLVHEILWELIIQRVITPGSGSTNPKLPFFRVTDYGNKVLVGGEFIPHDPANYLERYSELIGTPDPIALEYLKESLRTFNSGCYLAATMMLGIASEVIFLDLCDTLLGALKDAGEQAGFDKIIKGISMIAKFKFVRDKVEEIMKKHKRALPEDTVVALLSVFDLIRTQRNDIGHPQGVLSNLTRDQVFVYLRMFPQYHNAVQKVKAYLKTTKV